MENKTTTMERGDRIHISGRLDSSNASELDREFQDLANLNRYNLVVILSDVKYMSSAGLRALVSAQKACKRTGGNLVLVKPSPIVQEVLNLAGLESMFDQYPDAEEAIGSF